MRESMTLGSAEREVLRRYGLDDARLRGCTVRQYDFGEKIISETEAARYLYFVLGGKAKVGRAAPNGRDLILCFYVSEGMMGEMEYFSAAERGCSTVTVVSALRCVAVPLEGNRAYLDENARFARLAAQELAGKLLQSSCCAVENTLFSARTRLCRYIAAAAERGFFRDVMTDVACSVGVSYRHLYRMLGALCEEGILAKGETGYRILDAEGLRRLCGEA